MLARVSLRGYMTFNLHIIGAVDSESYAKFSEELTQLEYSQEEEITVELMSEGGDAYTAFAFYERIKNSPIHINIRATGFVASAAVLVLAAGDKREMTKLAWAMVHEDGGVETEGLAVFEMEREVKHMRTLELQWNEVLSSVTKISAAEWEVLNKKTTYLTPEACLNLGLIEEIV